jgi:cytochrome c553
MMLSLVAASGGVQAGGDVARGAELADDYCAGCHGDDGRGDAEIPGIAGMEAAKLAKLLADFKSGAIESEMAAFARDLSEQEMADLAAFYATLPN